MKASESITELATALCDFQVDATDAHKGAQGHNYKYANLETILLIVRPLMARHGLSVAQLPCGDVANMGVSTRLMHKSGEWLESEQYMGVTASRGMSEAQAAGSVITYMRRYALAAVLGITQTDDDAAVKDPSPAAKPEALATKLQKDAIETYVADRNIPLRRKSWLKDEDNWKTLTKSTAKSIIGECEDMKKSKEQDKAA